MTIRFRASEPGDAVALLRVWRRAVDGTHHFLSAQDRMAIDPLVADYVGSAALRIAERGGEIVAFMTASPIFTDGTSSPSVSICR